MFESLTNWIIRFCLENKLVVLLICAAVIGAGLIHAPFAWELDGLGIERRPVPVDAIPDIGENQQIVFTEWMGRSPQDVDDQITYPLTTALLGVPDVKTVRSYSYFGFSAIYVVFKDNVEFYWSRSRLLEKLSSLPPGTVPPDVVPVLGPDATALGQVFWYTIEGRDEAGNAIAGWDLRELRQTQDWYVRYALQGVDGVAEVASIGGFVQEYQIDVDPDAMRVFGVTLPQIFDAVRKSNIDVGARTIEVNAVEYVIRGRGFVRSVADLEHTVVTSREHVPVLLEQLATVSLGPALRRGALDKEGVEAVGGVVVVRYGANPLAVIERVKEKIAEISPGLPTKTLADGRVSKLTIVPFYDRTGLIHETLETLSSALVEEILITILVVILLLWHLRSAALVSALLPLAVLMCFIGMYWFGVDANIVALSGIAIAIGTLADMGIVLSENMLKHLEAADPGEPRIEVIYRGASEVGSAVLTAVATTVVSFLPVFTMEGAEGKLFKPLAYTKTFALVAAIIVTLTVLPAIAHILLGWSPKLPRVPERWRTWAPRVANVVLALAIARWLSTHWEPLGVEAGWLNLVFVVVVIGALLGALALFIRGYGVMLRWCLDHKIVFSMAPLAIVVVGAAAWSGLGKEFMPSLDEGSFLYMPTTMPHASIGESMDALRKQDLAIRAIPEVDQVIGKIGRVESSLDPAPISMVETIISYRPEYGLDADGNRVRQWRDHIRRPDDIWNEIVMAAQVPGSTAAPKLQPIETRLVMLQTGMRAPMGVKVYGPDNETIQAVGFELERLLKEVPELSPAAILADRIVGKPYLEIVWDRAALARYGLTMRAVQDVVEVAIGGRQVTSTVEGRERYPVRVRYPRERRDSIESLAEIIVPAPDGTQIPLGELAEVVYTPGPMVIKSEDTFLVGYVILDRADGVAEVDAVEAASAYLDAKKASGELVVPDGVHWKFSGSYENQIRAERRLAVILPLALGVIFLLLYLQFRRVTTAMLVFSGVFVAWAGGFILLWCYGQDWFLAGGWFGVDWRTLFQVGPLNLSVAVWVGFLALFGIITDDGVVMGTYLHQSFDRENPQSIAAFREATLTAGLRRVRPCMMITGTSILALLPVLTATGRGADVMRPMAVPAFGGMIIEVISMFIVPVVFCGIAEFRHRSRWSAGATDAVVFGTAGLAIAPMLLWCAIGDWTDHADTGVIEGPRA